MFDLILDMLRPVVVVVMVVGVQTDLIFKKSWRLLLAVLAEETFYLMNIIYYFYHTF